ncbi:MAG: type II toxin-antitoxin system RelE/ParE family toxin [Candidatus Omnitrophica bacterium]|nr:type II toxin-antitoxin system RelE/ParE family toxin [Candidatus Omnitrophota bacterium]
MIFIKYSIAYLPRVKEDIKHFSPQVKRQVLAAIDQISQNPYTAAKQLRDELKGRWSYRTTHYRIIYELDTKNRKVIVVLIAHRRSVYTRLLEMIREGNLEKSVE